MKPPAKRPFRNHGFESLIPDEPKLPGPAREPAPAVALLLAWRESFSQGRLAEAGVLLERLRLLARRGKPGAWSLEIEDLNGNVRVD